MPRLLGSFEGLQLVIVVLWQCLFSSRGLDSIRCVGCAGVNHAVQFGVNKVYCRKELITIFYRGADTSIQNKVAEFF